jgi:hypothetical protein
MSFPPLSPYSVFVSRSFWNYYLHPCQKTYAQQLAKESNARITWFDPPTRNPRTWLKENKFTDSSGVIVRRPFALKNEYERFGPVDRLLFNLQLKAFLQPYSKMDLWSIACHHSWLTKNKLFTRSIYWPGDFFDPRQEFEHYKNYDLVMPWTRSGIQNIPTEFNGCTFLASTCPGENFLHHDPSKATNRRFDVSNKFSKTIVYIGGLSNRRVNFPLLNAIAENLKDHALLLGAKSDNGEDTKSALQALLKMPNVFLFDDLDYSELPSLVQVADTCIIPYLVNDQTIGICPNKLFEYAALSKSIISSPIPSVLEYSPPVQIAKNDESFIRNIRIATSNPPTTEDCLKLRSIADNASPSESLRRIALTISN